MKVPFYILGILLRYGPQSGYSIKDIIEKTVSDFAKIKLPNIYYHLDKLKFKEYVSYIWDKDGARPEKTVYSITAKGKEYFQTLLLKQLEENVLFEFSLDGVLYFADNIDKNVLLTSLKLKRDTICEKLKLLQLHKEDNLKSLNENALTYASSIFDHHIIHFKAELTWLDKTIEGLK